MAKAKTEDEMVWTDKLANAAFLGVMAVARLLPYRRRIPVVGWFFSRLLGPIAGWSRRARESGARHARTVAV